ncbi:MAG: RluA family pseudouridine synthase [Deltaproteobacteria bacterium]|nr:MAG: RluA family pseudouridine synthase [Deltaproteobacteria bacterium]
MSAESYWFPLVDVVGESHPDDATPPSYWYEGACPNTGRLLRLPRSPLAEAVAKGLMQQLRSEWPEPEEGKMFGVLLVRRGDGEVGVLKAFSGLWRGQATWEGWAPQIPGREHVALEEKRTLQALEERKQEIIRLWDIPERDELARLQPQWEEERAALKEELRSRKQRRKEMRRELEEELAGEERSEALEALNRESQLDGFKRRDQKREWDALLGPLREAVEQADARIREIKQDRKVLSQTLQAHMHEVYRLTNFAGVSLSLRDLLPDTGIPTGTGECCAPKLLHLAAHLGMTPLAMAEFWWGPGLADESKEHGHFYGACAERCQPIMGFLLSGLDSVALPTLQEDLPMEILFQDEHMIAVNKPSGLLSVPGRYLSGQDSAVSRIRSLFPTISGPVVVHRLDQETSGVLVVACHAEAHRSLTAQFRERAVRKRYLALLEGLVMGEEGEIDLPLAPDPERSPLQKVDGSNGKPSLTKYKVLERTSERTRVCFEPVTGRTHQLRVHALKGLKAPIVGDTLYGEPSPDERLCLHAFSLQLQHPETGEVLLLESPPPF